MEQALETVREVVTVYGLRIVAAIVIFVVGRLAAGAVRRMLRKREVDATLTGFVMNFAYYAVLAFVVVATQPSWESRPLPSWRFWAPQAWPWALRFRVRWRTSPPAFCCWCCGHFEWATTSRPEVPLEPWRG